MRHGQYEIHFLEPARDHVIATIEAAGLRALVHPLTDDDLNAINPQTGTSSSETAHE